jgi:hypothetical protein
MKYLKVWTDFERIMSPLKDDEKGRLFTAMLHYAETGEEPESFTGNESFLWAVAKRDIDMMAERNEKLRQNGSKGGIAKSKSRQSVANDSNPYQDLANDSNGKQNIATFSLKEIKRNEMKRNENESSLIADDDAEKITCEQNRVLDAAEDAGFPRSNSVRAKLIALYADNGLQKMIDGIESCVTHGVVTLAYLTAVLKGEPKKEKNSGQKLPAQDYHQRENKNAQDEAFERMMALGGSA